MASFSVFLQNTSPETTGLYLSHFCFQNSICIKRDNPGMGWFELGHGSGQTGEFPLLGVSPDQVSSDLDQCDTIMIESDKIGFVGIFSNTRF